MLLLRGYGCVNDWRSCFATVQAHTGAVFGGASSATTWGVGAAGLSVERRLLCHLVRQRGGEVM